MDERRFWHVVRRSRSGNRGVFANLHWHHWLPSWMELKVQKHFQHFIISSLPPTPCSKAVRLCSSGLSNPVDVTECISEKHIDLRADSFSSAVAFGFQGKKCSPGVVQVSEFKSAHLKFPGSLIRSLAEHSRFLLDTIPNGNTHLEACQAVSSAYDLQRE